MPRLILARTDEPLDWLDALAPDWQVRVHQAGEVPQLGRDTSRDLLPNVFPDVEPASMDQVTWHTAPATLTFAALMADAILHDVQTRAQARTEPHRAPASGPQVTVFAPGHVFAQAPDFLALLDQAERFADVQPLSIGTGWAAALAHRDGRDWVDHWPVRAERFSLATLVPLACADDASLKAGRAYRRKHALAEGDNLLSHFLSLLGLDALAAAAAQADLGLMAHGSVFAVHDRLLDEAATTWGHRAESLRLLARADHNYPALFQHAWLHVFGLPFIALDGIAPAPVAAWQRTAAGMERVVASIDAVLAHTETQPLRRLPVSLESLGPPVLSEQVAPPPGVQMKPQPSLPALRAQAQHAAANGDMHTAWARLDQALQRAPQDIGLLADAASLAYQQGDHERALHCARRALSVDPQHLDCLFTLGMSLAALGQAEEAMDMLARLGEHPQVATWQAAHPDLGGALSQVMEQIGQPALPGTTPRVAA